MTDRGMGSSPDPGRTIASVAADIVAMADDLETPRFTAMGHSGAALTHWLALRLYPTVYWLR